MRVAMAGMALVTALAAGCAYQAGSFSHAPHTPASKRVSVGCLDLSIERRNNLPDGGAVIDYAFGNRCDGPAVVDLASARVEARTRSGRNLPLTAFDPAGEIRPVEIDGRRTGREALAYHSAGEELVEVCVEATSIVRVAEGAPPAWLCFREPWAFVADAGGDR